MGSISLRVLVVIVASLYVVTAFVSPVSHISRSQKLYENFGFDFAESQMDNTPRELFGEANYKSFVKSYDRNGLMIRVRFI